MSNIALSNRGKIQAEQVSKWANLNRISRIYSSTLLRTIETAKPTASLLNFDVIIEDRLNEVNFGDIEGLTPTEWETRFPISRRQFISNPATLLFPNGERGVDTLNRANEFLVELITKFEDEDGEVSIFCHGTLLRLILCSALGIDLNDYRRTFPTILNGLCTTVDLIYSESNKKICGSIYSLNYPGLISNYS
jgi:probable phosphoglycerate mutase